MLWLNLALHLSVIGVVTDYIFDEGWYIPFAKASVVLGQAVNLEHPPLFKILGGIVIYFFGDWWMAWRLPTVLMGVAAVYVFYRLAKNFMQEKYALVASTFLSFDLIFFIHSSIFLLDTPAILFGLLGVMLYFEKRYLLMANSFGLACLMKETGGFFVLIILIVHVALNYRQRLTKIKTLAVSVLIFIVITLGGLWIYDLTYKPEAVWNVSNPIDNLTTMYSAFTGILPLLRTPPSEVRQPWGWILPIGNPFNAPTYSSLTMPATFLSGQKLLSLWKSQISLPIAYFCLPILLFCAYRIVKKKSEPFDKLYPAWLLITFVPFVIRGLITPMRWNFYFIYTIPAICLGIGFLYSKMPEKTRFRAFALSVHLLITIVFFFIFWPIVL